MILGCSFFNAMFTLPLRLHYHYVLFFRYQNEAEYDKIWDTVKKVLNNGSFPVRFVDVAGGNAEAKYAWTSVNKLLGSEV